MYNMGYITILDLWEKINPTTFKNVCIFVTLLTNDRIRTTFSQNGTTFSHRGTTFPTKNHQNHQC